MDLPRDTCCWVTGAFGRVCMFTGVTGYREHNGVAFGSDLASVAIICVIPTFSVPESYEIQILLR